jgi:hypothetical protein
MLWNYRKTLERPAPARIPGQAKPRLLILYHAVSPSPEELLQEMIGRYSGHVVAGRNLEVY